MANKKAVNAPRRDVFMLDPTDVVVIGVDTDHRSKADHYLWDPRIKLPLDEGLVNNIRTYGVLKPVLVIKDGDKVIVADGRQRTMHAREAAKRAKAAGEEPVKLPVMFKRGEETYIFGVSRAANIHRQESIIDRATNAQRMIDMGASLEETAVAFGVKPSTLKAAWLPLLDLAPKVRHAVEKGEVAAQAAIALTNLSRAEQEAHLDELRAQGVKPTAAVLQNHVRQGQGKPISKTSKQRIDEAMEKLVDLYTRYKDGFEIKADDLQALSKLLTGKEMQG